MASPSFFFRCGTCKKGKEFGPHKASFYPDEGRLRDIVRECQAVASCLGHTMNMQGIFAQPRRLVTDSIQRICRISTSLGKSQPMKVVLMNSVGNQNRGLAEKVSVGEKVVIGLIRHLLPPHADNENAAEYLRTQAGPNIEWVAVRPDSLIDSPQVSTYEAHSFNLRIIISLMS